MILVCEPQCAGFEHVEVNSGLLAVVRSAFPSEEILFLAEAEHLRQVRDRLESLALSGVAYRAIRIAPRHASQYRRMPTELRLSRQVFRLASENGPARIIFGSVSGAGLVAVKALLRFYGALRCVVVLHGIVSTIVRRPRWVGFPFWFRNALSLPDDDRIRYLVYGPFVRKQIAQCLPKVSQQILSIDLPYLLGPHVRNLSIPSVHESLRFGFLGVGEFEKGIDLFLRISEEITALYEDGKDTSLQRRPEFVLVGHVIKDAVRQLSFRCVQVPSQDGPLSRADYARHAQSVDYAVFLCRAGLYDFGTSSSLFDAFCYGKPIIALRTKCFEYYFHRMGDIGYLCESLEEVKSVVQNLLTEDHSLEYKMQRRNILQGLEQLAISRLGESLASQAGPFLYA